MTSEPVPQPYRNSAIAFGLSVQALVYLAWRQLPPDIEGMPIPSLLNVLAIFHPFLLFLYFLFIQDVVDLVPIERTTGALLARVGLFGLPLLTILLWSISPLTWNLTLAATIGLVGGLNYAAKPKSLKDHDAAFKELTLLIVLGVLLQELLWTLLAEPHPGALLAQ